LWKWKENPKGVVNNGSSCYFFPPRHPCQYIQAINTMPQTRHSWNIWLNYLFCFYEKLILWADLWPSMSLSSEIHVLNHKLCVCSPRAAQVFSLQVACVCSCLKGASSFPSFWLRAQLRARWGSGLGDFKCLRIFLTFLDVWAFCCYSKLPEKIKEERFSFVHGYSHCPGDSIFSKPVMRFFFVPLLPTP
jgi:hypothetical protein